MNKGFKEFILQELAVDVGKQNDKQNSREFDWNKFYRDTDIPVLEQKDIGSNRYKLYRVYSSFFLTTENNDYLGILVLNINNRTGIITLSNSKLKTGFYNIMFTTILSLDIVDELLSDVKLSSNAIKAYLNLSINNMLSIKVLTIDGSYIDISRDNILNNNTNRFSVKEKYNKGSIRESFTDYYTRIYEVSDNDLIVPAYVWLYNNKDSWLDSFLFCEKLNLNTNKEEY